MEDHRSTDKRYSGDNRLIPPKSSYRRRCLAPRCRSSHPGAEAGPKGMAVRHLKGTRAGFRTSWDSSVPYLPWTLEIWGGSALVQEGPEWTNLWCTGSWRQSHRRVAMFGRITAEKHLSGKPTSDKISPGLYSSKETVRDQDVDRLGVEARWREADQY